MATRPAGRSAAPTKVSIHATLAGGDQRQQCQHISKRRFYPRHPRGWRHICKAGAYRQTTFLSTPPSRVATVHEHEQGRKRNVSIHATLAGGDGCAGTHCVEQAVSIHATLAGGDLRCGATRTAVSRFYPRHPRGWRPWMRDIADKVKVSFYPRHPRGWRRRPGKSHRYRVAFLSTPPSRVATGRSSFR